MSLDVVIVLLGLLVGVLCEEDQVIDLSWKIDPDIPRWPTSPPFRFRVVHNGTNGQYWYQMDEISMGTHISTHLDAPNHFHKGGWPVDQIPWSRLVNRPVHVVNVRFKVFPAQGKVEPDVGITAEDIKNRYELKYGKIQNGSVVLFKTGWARYWKQGSLSYKGSTSDSDPSKFHFPGLAEDGARLLAEERGVYGVGIDTLSIDRGGATLPVAHLALSARNVYILENVASLESLPPIGAILHVGVLKIGMGASGAPVRLIAVLPTSASTSLTASYLLFLTVFSAFFCC